MRIEDNAFYPWGRGGFVKPAGGGLIESVTLKFARIFLEDGFANALYFEQLIGLSPGKLCDGANVSCSKPCFVSDSTHTGALSFSTCVTIGPQNSPPFSNHSFAVFPRPGNLQARISQGKVKYPSSRIGLTLHSHLP